MKDSGMSGAQSASYAKLRRSAFLFFQTTCKLKKMQEVHKEQKVSFDAEVERYLSSLNPRDNENQVSFEYKEYMNGYDGTVTVRRSQKVSVEFDADAVERALGKKLAAEVVRKRYEITDMASLVQYLKECGADPAIFKSFIHVSKSVDSAALDKLEELGKVSSEQLDGCYTVQKGDPYFTLTSKKGQEK